MDPRVLCSFLSFQILGASVSRLAFLLSSRGIALSEAPRFQCHREKGSAVLFPLVEYQVDFLFTGTQSHSTGNKSDKTLSGLILQLNISIQMFESQIQGHSATFEQCTWTIFWVIEVGQLRDTSVRSPAAIFSS